MSWRFALFGAMAAILLLFVMFLFSNDPTSVEVFVIAPCVLLVALILLLLIPIPRTRRGSAKLLLATAAFIVTGTIGMRFEGTLRPTVRWAFFSHKFKAQVLARTDETPGTLKHVEWDGWGGAPVGDWTAYVVFDPTDSLNNMTGRLHPGVVDGIPCNVLQVQRLESHWYSVTLEVDEWWDRCRNE